MSYCCCIPEIHSFVTKLCRPIIYQDKYVRLSKTSTFHFSRTAQNNLRIFQLLNYLSSASCDELCCRCDTCPHAVVTQLVYSGQQAILYRPYRGTLLYKYTGSLSITVPLNTGSTLKKCFAISASRFLQVLLLHSLNSTCWIHAFDSQVFQRRIYQDTHDRLSKTSRFYFVASVLVIWSLTMYIINGGGSWNYCTSKLMPSLNFRLTTEVHDMDWFRWIRWQLFR